MLLAGNGRELDHGEHGRQRLEGPYQPVSFSGDWTTAGLLLDGPCRDFNVMTARGKARHVLDVVTIDERMALPEADQLLVFCLRGAAEIQGMPLAEGEMLQLDGRPGLLATGPAVMALVRIHEIMIQSQAPEGGSGR
jgi:environmental stress-induced protein Ves